MAVREGRIEMSNVDAYAGAKTKLLICEQMDNYPGAQGNSGLWRMCMTPKAMPFAQRPEKQKSPFARMSLYQKPMRFGLISTRLLMLSCQGLTISFV
jgi:hypothetical protein